MRTRQRPVIRACAASVAVVALVALSSCTDGDKAAEPAAEPDPTASDSSRAPSGDNGNLKDPLGARAELSDFECDAAGGTWSASGRLKNAENKAVTYLVRVSLADNHAGTVLGSAEKSVMVEAKDAARVEFDGFHTGDRKGSCVARVVKSS